MENAVKATLSLSVDAAAILERSATPRKRGDLVSRLLVAYAAAESGIDQVDVEEMKLMIIGLASANKTLELRVSRLERGRN